MQEYDRQHGVTETWSQVAEASRRYSTQAGDSETAALDESLSANLTRMRTFQERASLARQEIGELVGAGGAGAIRRPGDRTRARPALLRLALRTDGIGRARHRRGGSHADLLAADRGGRRTAPGACRRVHRRAVPGSGRAGPGDGGRGCRVRGRGRRAARRLRPRDGRRLWRLVGRGARPGAGRRRAGTGRDRRGGDGGAGRDEDRDDHEGHGPRGAADRDRTGNRGGAGPGLRWRGTGPSKSTPPRTCPSSAAGWRASCSARPGTRRRMPRPAAERRRGARRTSGAGRTPRRDRRGGYPGLSRCASSVRAPRQSPPRHRIPSRSPSPCAHRARRARRMRGTRTSPGGGSPATGQR